ncbi:MAG TPA: hypothetical protein VJ242_01010 [Patescibacteria group bacterium]|nr:hypothetical protein [Patescibacteria group bacterium]
MMVIFGLTLLSLWLTQSLWLPGWFTSHDGVTHLARLAQYLTLLADGQIPPRFAGTLLGHLGYPVFVFSYHLPFMIGSVFSFLGFNLTNSLKLVFGLSVFWSGLGMYLLLKQWFKPLASFVGAFLFLAAPYRLLLVFVRAAVGEALALSLLPWLLLALHKKNLIGIALMVGLVTLSHSLFWPMYWGLVLTYVLLIFKGWSRRYVGGLVLGLGLSAFYWLPLLLERKLIVFDQTNTNLAVGHLLELKQLLYSPWGYGYSHSGIEQDAMSFQVGIAQWLVVGAAVGWLLLKRRFPALVLWALVWFALAILLMVDWVGARYLWQNLAVIKMIDIPWRLISVAVFVVSFLAAWLVSQQKKLAWVLAFGLMAVALYTNRNHLRVNQVINPPEADFYTYAGTTTFLNEFRPRWRQSDKTNTLDPKVLSEAESDKIKLSTNRSNRLEFSTDFGEVRNVQINLLYYPGWHFFTRTGESWRELKLGEEIKLVEMTEHPVGFGQWTFLDIEGTLQMKAPAGEQSFRFTFTETPMRQFADWVSLTSLIIFLGALIKKRLVKL